MRPETRAEAKAAGLKRYFTGNPCGRGHVAERFSRNSACVKCESERFARFYAENREAQCEKSRAYLVENREAVTRRKRNSRLENIEQELERGRKYREANKEKVREATKAWRTKNPDLARTSDRLTRQKWRHANPEQARALNRIAQQHRRARSRKAEGKFTSADLDRIYACQKGRCAWCTAKVQKSAAHIDHIIPLVGGGSNWPRNLQYLCQPCNLSKGFKDPLTFAHQRGRLL